MKLFKKFRGYLLANTQINAVYYGEDYNYIIKLDVNYSFNIDSESLLQKKT